MVAAMSTLFFDKERYRLVLRHLLLNKMYKGKSVLKGFHVFATLGTRGWGHDLTQSHEESGYNEHLS